MKKTLLSVLLLSLAGIIYASSIEEKVQQLEKFAQIKNFYAVKLSQAALKAEISLQNKLIVLAEDHNAMKEVIKEKTKCRVLDKEYIVCDYPSFYDCASWRTKQGHPYNLWQSVLLKNPVQDGKQVKGRPVSALGNFFFYDEEGDYFEFGSYREDVLYGVTPAQCPVYKEDKFFDACETLSEEVGYLVFCPAAGNTKTSLMKSIGKEFVGENEIN